MHQWEGYMKKVKMKLDFMFCVHKSEKNGQLEMKEFRRLPPRQRFFEKISFDCCN